MSRTVVVIVAVLLAPSFAIASPRVALVQQTDEIEWGEPVNPPGMAAVIEKMPERPKQFALAVNSPTSWGGFAYAASGYAAITEHQALRMNIAWFKSAAENPGLFVLASVLEGEPIEDEAYRKGGMFDLSAGWMYFPRRVWSGPTIELGTVLRTKHTYVSDEYASPDEETIETTTVAGRALVGWHWDLRGRLFVSIAAGASYGIETGTVTGVDTLDDMTSTREVSRWKAGFEWCSRLGVAF